jgi:hypothetical protein
LEVEFESENSQLFDETRHLFAEHTHPRAAEALAEEQGTVKKSNALSSKRWHLQLEAWPPNILLVPIAITSGKEVVKFVYFWIAFQGGIRLKESESNLGKQLQQET